MRLLFDLLAGSVIFGSVLTTGLSWLGKRSPAGLGLPIFGVFNNLVSTVTSDSLPAVVWELSRIIESVTIAPAAGVFDSSFLFVECSLC